MTQNEFDQRSIDRAQDTGERIFARWAPRIIRNYLGIVIGGLLAWGTLYMIFGWSVNRYLDERDATLDRLDGSVLEYRRGTESQFDVILEDIRRVSDSIDAVSSSTAEIAERVAALEVYSAINTRTLSQIDEPRSEWDFAPVVSYTPEPFIGGADMVAVPGFDKMTATIPNPRSVRERAEAIERLLNAHRVFAQSQGRPAFIPEEHDFEVGVSNVLQADGSIVLQLTSRVVLRTKIVEPE